MTLVYGLFALCSVLFLLYLIFHSAVSSKLEKVIAAVDNEVSSIEGKASKDFYAGAAYVLSFLKKHLELLALTVAILLCPVVGQAQVPYFQAGHFIASEFNGWVLYGGTTVGAGSATATASITNPIGNYLTTQGNACTVYTRSAGSLSFNPIFVGNKLLINDSNAETVTITAINGCSFTATFANAHTAGSYTITSGTYGLTEAMAYAYGYGGGLVVVAPGWQGTTAMITALIATYANVAVEDIRTGNVTYPALKATTGTRFVCTDTNGKLTSSASACSGT